MLNMDFKLFFLIKFHLSTGRGWVLEEGDCSHYMKNFHAPHVPLRLPSAKKLLGHINKVGAGYFGGGFVCLFASMNPMWCVSLFILTFSVGLKKGYVSIQHIFMLIFHRPSTHWLSVAAGSSATTEAATQRTASAESRPTTCPLYAT
jgi:hypothetical protein